MIRVETRLLPNSSSKDIMSSITTQAANAAAKEFAKTVEAKVKTFKCEKHPSTGSTIRIIADKKEIIKIDKNSFCCKEFADSIQINVKR
ncbi:hypothetical protein [Pontibacter mucosus]|uniref:hypothetical protein n=1 Tax=Pontibacter mucosus TaxID=1649266 RepID=UPI000D345973|nr:hypothetical protein [Pontibacter mucosus]